MNEMCIPSTPEHLQEDDSWQPGDIIPTSASVESGSVPFSAQNQPLQANLMSEIRSMFQTMQTSIEKSFDDMKGKLTDLETRISGVEDKQQLAIVNASTPMSSSSESASEFGRKRRSPPELQVRMSMHVHCVLIWLFFLQYEVRKVHGAFSHENQLLLDERYTFQ